MDKIEEAKIIANSALDRIVSTYQKKLNENFELDDYTKEKLTELYNRTNEEVLILALAKYQAKLLKQKEKMI